jgi:two-component system cell cycle sensor histidine kinase/response regulator CckA
MPDTSRIDILVVEDESVISADLCECLNDMGYQVVGEAASGEEALRKAARHKPDIVLMDIVLDGEMDGIAAAERLQQDHDIPVIFLTSHADTGTIRRATSTEPFGYLVKPFAEREIQAAIETALSRHQAESRFRKLERWTTTLLHSIGDGVLATDRVGRVNFLNREAERLTGWRHQEACGRPINEVFCATNPVSEQTAEDRLQEAMTQDLVKGAETGTRLSCRQGEEVPIDDSVAPIRDDDGNVTGAVMVFRDRSEVERAEDERRRLERKLQEGQKLESLGLLAGGIAHDFNNLLAGIAGNAALCRMKLVRSSPLHEHLHKIQTISHRAAELCRQMLAYAGKGRFRIAPLDLSALVAETTSLLNVSICKKVRIHIDLAMGLKPVMADATQIQQIVMNLVINGSDAIGGQPGEIRIKTGVTWGDREIFDAAVQSPDLPEGEYVFLEVADTGCGMEAETISKIFDPFFTTKFTGRGLGLAAVLGIVTGHHGALIVRSEPGWGSTFRLLLPVAPPEVEHAPKTSGAAAPPLDEWRGSGPVLVVDDEDEVRTVVAEMLREFGFEPVLAADGQEALALCRSRGASEPGFRLAVLDITMPVMDGVETLRELHKLDPKLPALFISGYSEQEASIRFGEESLSEFLQKPFLPGELKDKVRSVCE